MEVFDFEDDHLASVLPNDRNDDEQETFNNGGDDSKTFVSPTEQETRSKLAANKRKRDAAAEQPPSRHHGNFRGGGNRVEISIETDTSSQRYQHLPSYAQTTFVEKSETIREIPKDLPSGMLLPEDDRQYAILRRTAESVVESPQLEFMLKVKQADNPDFDFLRADNKYFPFYQWYKNSKRPPKPVTKPDDDKPLLGGLLDGYSLSSSSDDDDTAAASKRPPPDDIAADEAALKKAQRLQRAKMMREHFQNKMNS